jgi:hypothetical protein
VRIFHRLAQDPRNPMNWSAFHSGSREVMAHNRWLIHVGLPVRAVTQFSGITKLTKLPIPAGSSSLALTTSGAYSEGIAHTCRRYGSVAEKHFFCSLWGPQIGLRLISFYSQVYSLVRLAMLLFVVLSMVGFDATRPINCQVSLASRVCLLSYTAS